MSSLSPSGVPLEAPQSFSISASAARWSLSLRIGRICMAVLIKLERQSERQWHRIQRACRYLVPEKQPECNFARAIYETGDRRTQAGPGVATGGAESAARYRVMREPSADAGRSQSLDFA